MRSRQLQHRVGRLTVREASSLSSQLVIVSPETWPAEDLAAFDTAREAGDLARQDAIVERVTGIRINRRRPGVHTLVEHPAATLIVLRSRSDGPQ